MNTVTMNTVELNEKLNMITLSNGNHAPNYNDMCVMEAVAYVAGEPWSDHPQCACPVITEFMIRWNDNSSKAAKDRWIKPLVPMLLNSRNPAARAEWAAGAADQVNQMCSDLIKRALGIEETPDA